MNLIDEIVLEDALSPSLNRNVFDEFLGYNEVLMQGNSAQVFAMMKEMHDRIRLFEEQGLPAEKEKEFILTAYQLLMYQIEIHRKAIAINAGIKRDKHGDVELGCMNVQGKWASLETTH